MTLQGKFQFWQNLTIRRRLWAAAAFNLFVLIWVGLVAYDSIAITLSQSRKISNASRLQKFQQEADMYHDSLRAQVFASALLADTNTLNDEAILLEFAEDSMLFRNALEAMMGIDVDQDIKASLAKTIPVTQEFILASDQMHKQLRADRKQALAQLDAYLALFEQLKKSLAVQTTLIEKHISSIDEGVAGSARSGILHLWMALSAAAALILMASYVSGISISKSLAQLVRASHEIAAGNFKGGIAIQSRDELGEVATGLDHMAGKLAGMISQMQRDSRRDQFGKQIVEALEMADSERQVHDTIGRAMTLISDNPMELLLADSSKANLERAASHGCAGAPGCGVDAPYNCIAVRRGSLQSFEDSNALNACPHLRGRTQEGISAVCIPVNFMGRSLGVLHSSGPLKQLPDPETVEQLNLLAFHAGARIGTVRAFDKTQKLASTDSLTGLANRWSGEERISKLTRSSTPYAFVLADLDNFKRLNDTYGHNAGDKCLRLFAAVLRKVLRGDDLPCRWGGEEFAIIMPSANATVALQVLERLRTELAHTIEVSAATPFTASFGVADTAMASDFDKLVLIADDALYQSKSAGRNRATLGTLETLQHKTGGRPSEQQSVINLTMLQGVA